MAGCLASEEPDESARALFGFNNGLKIGDVTPESARIWTRLSRNLTMWRWGYQVWYPPAVGTVQLTISPDGSRDTQRSFERRAHRHRDGTVQFQLDDLEPATQYQVTIRGEPDGPGAAVEITGGFSTAPPATAPAVVKCAVVSCQAWRFRDDRRGGFRTYRTIDERQPDFFVHTGDMVYYDQGNLLGRSVPTARTHWHRTYSLDSVTALHRHTPAYFLKDDHDILDDDCWPGQRYGTLTFEDGVSIFKEQNPTGEVPYKTVRWGSDLQIWLLEMREFRSPNFVPDGPEKTILGTEQIQWLKESIDSSDAPFRVVISPSIFVGPDRWNKNDNYANVGFKTEGDNLREFLADRDVVIVGGDRHWQYVSVDETTGLWEFGCGALAKGREGGWNSHDRRPQHRFLAVKPGFIWMTVQRTAGEPRLSIDHRNRHGGLRHRVQFTANPLEPREAIG